MGVFGHVFCSAHIYTSTCSCISVFCPPFPQKSDYHRARLTFRGSVPERFCSDNSSLCQEPLSQSSLGTMPIRSLCRQCLCRASAFSSASLITSPDLLYPKTFLIPTMHMCQQCRCIKRVVILRDTQNLYLPPTTSLLPPSSDPLNSNHILTAP